VGGDQDQRNLEAEREADEVVRVVFKAELEANEEPVGRIAIVRRSDDRSADVAQHTGQWIGLIEAEVIAHHHGAPLVEV
jgi:hypothetical protein